MKVLLGTTYLLPTAGITIKELSKDATEDKEIQNLKKNTKFLDLISTINPTFQIHNLNEVQQ